MGLRSDKDGVFGPLGRKYDNLLNSCVEVGEKDASNRHLKETQPESIPKSVPIPSTIYITQFSCTTVRLEHNTLKQGKFRESSQ